MQVYARGWWGIWSGKRASDGSGYGGGRQRQSLLSPLRINFRGLKNQKDFLIVTTDYKADKAEVFSYNL